MLIVVLMVGDEGGDGGGGTEGRTKTKVNQVFILISCSLPSCT